MSLKGFHVVFISVSTLMATFCALLFLREWQAGAGASAATGAAVSAVGGVALLVYGVAFYRKMGRLR